jgi:hypothetical protein
LPIIFEEGFKFHLSKFSQIPIGMGFEKELGGLPRGFPPSSNGRFCKKGAPFNRSFEDNEISLVSLENELYFEQEAEGVHLL